MKKVALLLVLFWGVSCQRDSDIQPAIDCLIKSVARMGDIIEGEYIVSFKPLKNARIAHVTSELLHQYTISDTVLSSTFEGAEVRGFVAHLNIEQAKALAHEPTIAAVEPDRIVGICGCVDITRSSTLTWNVKKTGYGNGLNFGDKTAWIIDTGIDLDHPDLNVDTQRSKSFLSGFNSADDNNGHGTHVAGIIGALNNQIGVVGVASGAKLVSLKVLNELGSGKLSAILQALAYLNKEAKIGDVVNISIGGEGVSETLDKEIKAIASKGILFAIAAGNDAIPAQRTSPARANHANIFTVSAIDSTDTFASFSNFGNDVVDVAAYGVRITSTYIGGRYAIASGTSMSAPHVAGLMMIRGNKVPTRGTARRDPDGVPDPIARSE